MRDTKSSARWPSNRAFQLLALHTRNMKRLSNDPLRKSKRRFASAIKRKENYRVKSSKHFIDRKKKRKERLALVRIIKSFSFQCQRRVHVAFVLDEREIRWDGLILFYVITIREWLSRVRFVLMSPRARWNLMPIYWIVLEAFTRLRWVSRRCNDSLSLTLFLFFAAL